MVRQICLGLVWTWLSVTEVFFVFSVNIAEHLHVYLKHGVARVSCSKSARHWLRRLPPSTRRNFIGISTIDNGQRLISCRCRRSSERAWSSPVHKYKSTYRECFYTINLARSFWTDKFRHCRREERGEKHCDHDCVRIYECIYLSAQVSQKPHVQTQRNFLYVLRAVVARCSRDDNAMRSVLPVLSDWVTSTWFEAAVAQKVWLCVCSEVQIVCTVQLMSLHLQTPSSLASFKFRLVLPFWYRLPRLLSWKRGR